jgi:hypothetical protein
MACFSVGNHFGVAKRDDNHVACELASLMAPWSVPANVPRAGHLQSLRLCTSLKRRDGAVILPWAWAVSRRPRVRGTAAHRAQCRRATRLAQRTQLVQLEGDDPGYGDRHG